MNLSGEPQGAAGIEMAVFTDRGYRSRAAREKAPGAQAPPLSCVSGKKS